MKWSLFLLCTLLLVSAACERHPVTDLALVEESNSEGVRPEPKRDAPQLETSTTAPQQPNNSK